MATHSGNLYEPGCLPTHCAGRGITDGPESERDILFVIHGRNLSPAPPASVKADRFPSKNTKIIFRTHPSRYAECDFISYMLVNNGHPTV